MKSKVIAASVALMVMASAAAAATVDAITEGARDRVLNTTLVGGDASNSPEGYALNGGNAFGAGDSVDIYGRIVGATDFYNFTTTSAFKVTFIFGGYEYHDGSPAETVSGFVRESGGNNAVNMFLYKDGKGGGNPAINPINNPYTTNITSTAENGGTDMIFAILGAGNYTLEIDNTSPSAAALYDIRISAVPVPAAGFLLLTGLAGLGAIRRRNAS